MSTNQSEETTYMNWIVDSKLNSEINRYIDYNNSLREYSSFLKSYISLRCKDMLIDTLEEYSRIEDFIRIYPSKETNYYNKFFSGKRTSNILIYKLLYTEDLISLKQQELPLIPSIDNCITKECKLIDNPVLNLLVVKIEPIKKMSLISKRNSKCYEKGGNTLNHSIGADKQGIWISKDLSSAVASYSNMK